MAWLSAICARSSASARMAARRRVRTRSTVSITTPISAVNQIIPYCRTDVLRSHPDALANQTPEPSAQVAVAPRYSHRGSAGRTPESGCHAVQVDDANRMARGRTPIAQALICRASSSAPAIVSSSTMGSRNSGRVTSQRPRREGRCSMTKMWKNQPVTCTAMNTARLKPMSTTVAGIHPAVSGRTYPRTYKAYGRLASSMAAKA